MKDKTKLRLKIAGVVTAAGVAVTGVAGCASMTEPWNDAPIERKYDNPAEVYSMPDGFANIASKCDAHGHRMFSTREGAQGGGKVVAVVPNDPSCKGKEAK